MDGPRLIETSAQNYIFNTLQQCHSNRVNVYFYALNIGVVVLLLLFLAARFIIVVNVKYLNMNENKTY